MFARFFAARRNRRSTVIAVRNGGIDIDFNRVAALRAIDRQATTLGR